jgi:hypothetical protein
VKGFHRSIDYSQSQLVSSTVVQFGVKGRPIPQFLFSVTLLVVVVDFQIVTKNR